MKSAVKGTVIMAAASLLATGASAQSAREILGRSPLVAIEDEASPRLIVDLPLPEALAMGWVFIQYRTENLRIVPVFGKAPSMFRPGSGTSTSPSTTPLGTGPMPAAKRSSLSNFRPARIPSSSNSPTRRTR
jgi:hypothetical protein